MDGKTQIAEALSKLHGFENIAGAADIENGVTLGWVEWSDAGLRDAIFMAACEGEITLSPNGDGDDLIDLDFTDA